MTKIVKLIEIMIMLVQDLLLWNSICIAKQIFLIKENHLWLSLLNLQYHM